MLSEMKFSGITHGKNRNLDIPKFRLECTKKGLHLSESL